MQIKPEQIKQTLEDPSSPIRLAWVHGEDPTLMQQAVDTIYDSLPCLLGMSLCAENSQASIEKQTFNVDAQTNWREIAEASFQQSLFYEATLLDLRFRTHNATADAKAVLTQHAQRTQNTHFILVTSPRLDAKFLNSAFIKTLKEQMLLIPIWPLNNYQYRQWLVNKLVQTEISLSKDAFEWFIDASEGNLSYADQEIKKLRLCFESQTTLTLDQIKTQMGYATHLNIFEIIQRLHQGHTRDLDIHLEQLRVQGEAPIRIMGAIQRELDLLIKLKQAQISGNLDKAMKQARIFGPKIQTTKKALSQLNEVSLTTYLDLGYEIDRNIKGASNIADETIVWQLIKELLLCLGESNRKPLLCSK